MCCVAFVYSVVNFAHIVSLFTVFSRCSWCLSCNVHVFWVHWLSCCSVFLRKLLFELFRCVLLPMMNKGESVETDGDTRISEAVV